MLRQGLSHLVSTIARTTGDEADWLQTAVGDHPAGVIMRRRGDWWIAYAPVAA